jgi:hypothetical protein
MESTAVRGTSTARAPSRTAAVPSRFRCASDALKTGTAADDTAVFGRRSSVPATATPRRSPPK